MSTATLMSVFCQVAEADGEAVDGKIARSKTANGDNSAALHPMGTRIEATCSRLPPVSGGAYRRRPACGVHIEPLAAHDSASRQSNTGPRNLYSRRSRTIRGNGASRCNMLGAGCLSSGYLSREKPMTLMRQRRRAADRAFDISPVGCGHNGSATGAEVCLAAASSRLEATRSI